MNLFKKILVPWLYVDIRSLALFRIIFGFLCFCDVVRRYALIDVFYSDLGMDFRQQVLSKYSIKYFSLLNYLHTSFEVHIFFILTALSCCLLIIGYRTRIFQFLTAFGLISIHNAAVILENGADMVYNNYLIWSLFLPLGTACSIDSIRQSMKKNIEYDSNALNNTIKKSDSQIFHFAYIACLVQLAMIYYYNFLNKTGNMWEDGTAVYYMYQLETFLTPFGAWISSKITMTISKLLTFMTLYLEYCIPIAILFPLFQPWLRRIAFVIAVIFHFSKCLSQNIGVLTSRRAKM